MANENTFYFRDGGTVPAVVWGTGNMGRAAIRAVDAHPGLRLSGVVVANPEKVGRDAGDLASARGSHSAGSTGCSGSTPHTCCPVTSRSAEAPFGLHPRVRGQHPLT